MKKTLFLITAFLSLHFIGLSQDFPDYGVITQEELALKECAFDKEANAVILINEAFSDHDEQYHLITTHHVRIKILKEKGFEAANISIPFFTKNDFEVIERLEAMVINVDANGQQVVEKLPKKAFYKKEINERIGVVTFTFPNVKVGSIIEYKYRSFMKNYNGLDDWDFQKELPVVNSKYTLTVLPNTEFSFVINKRDDMQVLSRVEKETGRVYFEMMNIPALTDEPYMDAREDCIQKVIFQLSGYNNNGSGKTNYMTSWAEVIKELLGTKEFGSQLEKNISGTGEFTDEVKKMQQEEDKMKAVYNYVRSNMSWNDVHSKYAIEGVKEAWAKKKGTSGEINLILVNLLKEVGLEVYPTLISERSHGKVAADIPFVDQFNSVLACVIIKNRKYFLDATNLYTPAHITPNNILNTTALIVNKKNGGIVDINNDSLKYANYISVLATLKDSGQLAGEVYIKGSDYARIDKISDYKSEGEEKYINNNYQKNGITVKDFQFLNQNNDSLPTEEKFNFNTNLVTSGDYLYVPMNMFSGFEKNPFLSSNRFSNINFGYKRAVNVYTSLILPKNYAVDALPKNLTMSTPDKDIVFTRSISYNKEANELICVLGFEFKQSLYWAQGYPTLKEVYKKIFEYLKEPVVLKK